MKHGLTTKTRIVIAGGGFAGLYAARCLDKRLDLLRLPTEERQDRPPIISIPQPRKHWIR